MNNQVKDLNDSTLLSIREFSKFTGVTQSTLRYYDEIGLLPPTKRGENNYRYYLPFQIITLNFVNVLADLGVPLSVIKNLSKDRSPGSVIELLSQQQARLNQRLHELQSAYSVLHIRRDNIQSGLLAQEGVIRVEELDEYRIVFGPPNDFGNDDTFYRAFMQFCNSAASYRINIRNPIGAYHDDMNAFLKTPSQPQKFFSLDPAGNTICKNGKYLAGYCRGYYGEFGDMPERMAAFAKENGLVFSGPVYVIYLLDEISVADPDSYLSKITVGLTSKKINKTRTF
jgi:DNA-binding transcriptional MerR regulator